MIKNVSTSSGDAGARRRGPWSGDRETWVWGIETRGVVKVNRMSTEFRGVSLCHSWTYASYWNGEDVDVKNTNRAAVARIVSCAPCRSIVFTRRRSRRSFALVVVASERSLASRVTPSRRVVSSSRGRANEQSIGINQSYSINHDGAREMPPPPIGVVARARDRGRGRVSFPRDDRRDGRASRR